MIREFNNAPKETHSSPAIEHEKKIVDLEMLIMELERNASELSTQIKDMEAAGEVGEDIKEDLEIQKRITDGQLAEARRELATHTLALPKSMN